MKHQKLYAPAALRKLKRRTQKKRAARELQVERRGYAHYRGCVLKDGWRWGTHEWEWRLSMQSVVKPLLLTYAQYTMNYEVLNGKNS